MMVDCHGHMFVEMRVHTNDHPGNTKPRSRSVHSLVDQMGDRVMPYLKLDATWKTRIIAALKVDEPRELDQGHAERLQRALKNLRKQHLWGDLSD